MSAKEFEDYTEEDFLLFVKKIYNSSYSTEEQQIEAVFEFERLTQHPDGSDLIYYPRDGREDSPEGVVKEVKEWRASSGRSGFKPE
ncbi:bacteriocin immunity protein [Pseudomonas allokribbensis]|uniref:bacteriocin immunity protein n=1 Tax=Pseudomonas allokribbensis TaxID=2774460 RepID=UPI0017883562|nr:bacteriocin immunity protein [Pseudomonas allokribbensis]